MSPNALLRAAPPPYTVESLRRNRSRFGIERLLGSLLNGVSRGAAYGNSQSLHLEKRSLVFLVQPPAYRLRASPHLPLLSTESSSRYFLLARIWPLKSNRLAFPIEWLNGPHRTHDVLVRQSEMLKHFPERCGQIADAACHRVREQRGRRSPQSPAALKERCPPFSRLCPRGWTETHPPHNRRRSR